MFRKDSTNGIPGIETELGFGSDICMRLHFHRVVTAVLCITKTLLAYKIFLVNNCFLLLKYIDRVSLKMIAEVMQISLDL